MRPTLPAVQTNIALLLLSDAQRSQRRNSVSLFGGSITENITRQPNCPQEVVRLTPT